MNQELNSENEVMVDFPYDNDGNMQVVVKFKNKEINVSEWNIGEIEELVQSLVTNDKSRLYLSRERIQDEVVEQSDEAA